MLEDTTNNPGQPLPPTIPLDAVIECAKSIPIPAQSWALWAADCAERVLPIFEAKYPNDNRPRLAIEAARGVDGDAAYAAAAYAAAYAAYAAAADAAARAAADAADAAAYAAYAAYAADAAYAAYAADAAARAAGIDQGNEETWQAIRLLHYITLENK